MDFYKCTKWSVGVTRMFVSFKYTGANYPLVTLGFYKMLAFPSFTCVDLDYFIQSMERRAARVSEAQWNVLLDFLERNPNLARARGYNNSAQGRAESSRLWVEVAGLLNAEGSGATKTPKDWSVYVSNNKSKLKKIIADINTDANATGGGPSQGRINALSETENRFLALMGQGFGQSAPTVSVHPFPDMEQQQPINSLMPQIILDGAEEQQEVVIGVQDLLHIECEPSERNITSPSPRQVNLPAPTTPADATPANLPRLTRQRRYRSRPLAPLDEARRILSEVEMQRAAADAEKARAIHLMAQNIGRLADAAERYLLYHKIT